MKKSLILAFFVLMGTLSATSHYLDLSMKNVNTEVLGEKEDVFGTNALYMSEGRFNNINFTIANDLFFRSDDNYEFRKSIQQNDFSMSAYWMKNNHYLKVQYGNRFYLDSQEISITGYDSQVERKMTHNSQIKYIYNAEKFNYTALMHFRTLTFDEFEGESDLTDNDSYFKMKFGYTPIEELEFFAAPSLKNDQSSSASHAFNIGGVDVGANYVYSINPFQFIEFEGLYRFEKSDQLLDLFKLQTLGEIRYNFVFSQKYSGYLDYQVHTGYDSDEETLYVLDNIYRLVGKYSFWTDNQKDSFVKAGVKLNSVEDKVSYIADARISPINNFALETSNQISPDFYTKMKFRGIYLLKNNYEFWIQYENKDYEKNDRVENSIAIGTTLNL